MCSGPHRTSAWPQWGSSATANWKVPQEHNKSTLFCWPILNKQFHRFCSKLLAGKICADYSRLCKCAPKYFITRDSWLCILWKKGYIVTVQLFSLVIFWKQIDALDFSKIVTFVIIYLFINISRILTKIPHHSDIGYKYVDITPRNIWWEYDKFTVDPMGDPHPSTTFS